MAGDQCRYSGRNQGLRASLVPSQAESLLPTVPQRRLPRAEMLVDCQEPEQTAIWAALAAWHGWRSVQIFGAKPRLTGKSRTVTGRVPASYRHPKTSAQG